MAMNSVTCYLSNGSIKKLRYIFDEIDSDHSGSISQDELILACRKLSIDVETNQLKDFLESDVSGDGELNFHEFCHFYLACLRRIFNEIDADDSGSIGVDELRSAFCKVGFHVTEREVLSLLAQVDKDNSETVDFSEFCNFFCSLPAPNFRLIVEKWASGLSVDTGSDLVPPPLPPPSIIVWRALFAGGIAGIVSRTATAPIEKIKILAQTQTNGEIRFTKALTTVLQKEGLRGLYAGNGVNCVRVFPFSAIVCLVYANLARLLPLDGDHSTANSLWRMGAGASAGIIATLLTHPIDVVRARITVQQTKQYKGLFHGIRVIAAAEKMAGLYRGIGPTLTAIAPFMAVQQVVYDILKQRSIENSITPSATLFFLCGSAAGAAAQTAVYPLEVIRRRMQLHSATSVKGQTSLSTFKKLTYRQLFSGLVPTYIKVVPAAAISLLVRDAVLGRSLTSKEDEHQFQKHGASFHNCLQAHEPSCTLCKGQTLQYSVVNTQIEDSVVQYALSTGTNLRESPQGKRAISLLIKQKEERATEDEMRKKQQEFSERMENCIHKRNQLKKKKEKLEQHIQSFRHILQDSEIRKFRATQKTSSESKELSLKVQEVDMLSKDLSRSIARKHKTTKKIAKYSKVASFMECVHAVAPQGYLDENLPSCEAVMSRYHTLLNAKKYIQDKSNGMMQEIKVLHAIQIAHKTSHTNEIMALTTHLANLKSQLEILSEKNLTMQEAIDKKMEAYQQKHQTLYMVLNTIDNVSESCKQYSLQSMKVDKKSPVQSKLKHIQEFCIHWSEVVAHVMHQWDGLTAL